MLRLLVPEMLEQIVLLMMCKAFGVCLLGSFSLAI